MVIWVPGSPIDCADTIPADSFASIAWRSNFSQIFVRTSWRRFLLNLSPWIFFASSPTTYRGSQRPISFSPSMISCSPAVSGGAFTGIVSGVSGSASAAFAAGFRPRAAGFALFLRALDVHVLLREAVRRHLLLPETLLPGRLLTEDLLKDVVDVDRSTLHASGRIHAVLTELKLDDRVRRIPDRPVFFHLEILEGVDQAALHVSRPRRAHGRVDEAFAPAHRVEEVFRRMEAALIRRFHEAFRLGP